MSRFKDKAPLHETKDYGIYVGAMVDKSWEGQRGYLLGNKRTGVVEGELSVEYVAIKTMRDVQEELDKVLGASEVEAPVTDADEFQAMVDRLTSEDELPIG